MSLVFLAVHEISLSPRYERALHAIADLLGRLRLDFMFLGNVARAAWLGGNVETGSLDVLALMAPEQKNQVAMMGGNRGFRVDRSEVEQTEELDLVPLTYDDPEGGVRIHVLVASNALYGRMVPKGVPATVGEQAIKVAAAEDLALLLAVADDAASQQDREKLIRLPEFDRRGFNSRLTAIGLSHLVIAE